MQVSGTDTVVPARASLMRENEELRRRLAQTGAATPQRPVAVSPRPAPRRVMPSALAPQSGATRPPPEPTRGGTVHFSLRTPEGERGFHSAEREADSEGSQAEEPLDGLGRLMQQFDYGDALRARGGRPSASSGVDFDAALPSRGGRSSASSGRPAARPQSGRGDELPAAVRDAPP